MSSIESSIDKSSLEKSPKASQILSKNQLIEHTDSSKLNPGISTTSTNYDNSANVRVIARVRPPNEKEKLIASSSNSNQNFCVEYGEDSKLITILTEYDRKEKTYEKHKFNFDYVFNPSSTQSDIFNISARPIVDSNYKKVS